jgi:hypothetical protein
LPQIEELEKERLQKAQRLGLHIETNPKTRAGLGLHMIPPSKRPDFGVSDDQVVNPKSIRQALGLGIASLGKGGKS